MSGKYKRNGRNNGECFRWGAMLAVYLVYLAVFTLSPFQFSFSWFRSLYIEHPERINETFLWLRAGDVIVNIFLFMPLGWLVYRRDLCRERSPGSSILRPLLAGALVSLLVETAQLFLRRTTSLPDFVSNTTGTVAGYLLANVEWLRDRVRGFFNNASCLFAVGTLYTACLVALTLLPFHLNSLRTWNESYPLLIGDELDGNRQWRGDIRGLAVYGNALDARDIAFLSRLPWKAEHAEERNRLGAVAQYIFSESSGDKVPDLSSSLKPLFLLRQENPYLASGGLKLEGLHPVISAGPAASLTARLKTSGVFSVEWFSASRDLEQKGPARIISISGSATERNMTAGQEGRDLCFRVRTRLTGSNGARPVFIQKNVFRDTGSHHFVIRFSRGFIRLWVDGKPHPDHLTGDMGFLLRLLKLGKGWPSTLAFYFAFYFPVGLVFHGVFRKGRIWKSGAVALALIISLRLGLWFWNGQPVRPAEFLLPFGAAVLGSLSGSVFEKRRLAGK